MTPWRPGLVPEGAHIPTVDRLGVSPPKDVNVDQVAQEWIASLSTSVAAKDIDGIIRMYDEGALNPERRIDDDDRYYEPSERGDDNQSRAPTEYGMAPSRVQSMLDRSFGSKWDGPRLGGGR